MRGLERHSSQYTYPSIYEFTIKRDGFNESVQIYAESMDSAVREILKTTDGKIILKVEKV